MKMQNPRQLALLKKEKSSFGGNLLRGNAREKRPFSRKCATHTVLKSQYARGSYSFLLQKNQKALRGIIYGAAKLFYVKIDRYVNVGNHIHLLIKAPNRQSQAHFFRTISALIVRQVTGARKGFPSQFEKFWDNKPFTRLVAWNAYKSVLHYLALNSSLEAIGFTKTTAEEYLLTFSTT